MKRFLYILAVIAALGLTCGGASALVQQVSAADGFKSSVIAFVLSLGLALLGPAFLAAAVFFYQKGESRAGT